MKESTGENSAIYEEHPYIMSNLQCELVSISDDDGDAAGTGNSPSLIACSASCLQLPGCIGFQYMSSEGSEPACSHFTCTDEQKPARDVE